MFGPPPGFSLVRSSAASDVYKERVVAVVVALVPTPADSAPLVVVLPQIHVASLLGGVPEKVIVKSSPASIPAGILKPRSAIKPNSLLF